MTLIAAVVASKASTRASSPPSPASSTATPALSSSAAPTASSPSSGSVGVGLSRHRPSPGLGRSSHPRPGASVTDRGRSGGCLGPAVEPLNTENLEEVGVTASEAAGVIIREEGSHGAAADSDVDVFRIVWTSLTIVIAH